MTAPRTDLRNVAIIAHVDHGKTTLVDQMLKQSGRFRDSELAQECILDSNPLERERGITILAKNIAFRLADNTKINLIDTPGHSDFGGEVERVLSMADGCFLLVDAAEGPLPQTRFVLRKAFAKGLKPIVVINKIDRGDARPVEVLNEVYDLFIELDATDEQMEFPVIYAAGRQGVATTDLAVPPTDLQPLYREIVTHIPPPVVDTTAPLQMLVVSLISDQFVGRIAVGKVVAGTIKKGQRVALMKRDGSRVDDTVVQLQEFDRLGRRETESVSAGDIC
ncbi:MAG TPA: GTP-binding protein, partial [Gemmataceae bacterium]|nr:GTP-binding protein [Gemmataceae bacterium]